MDNSITISNTRYKQLIAAETRLDIIKKMFEREQPYNYEKYCDILGIEIKENSDESES